MVFAKLIDRFFIAIGRTIPDSGDERSHGRRHEQPENTDPGRRAVRKPFGPSRTASWCPQPEKWDHVRPIRRATDVARSAQSGRPFRRIRECERRNYTHSEERQEWS